MLRSRLLTLPQVFMTRQDDLACAHEPFGDAFYFGPEHLGLRFADEAKAREDSGFVNTTYKDVLDSLLKQDKDKVGFPFYPPLLTSPDVLI